jgi:2-polyprenyl-3-methyl-5-hydroxy-6-metoxy-1,4-benzoquinol methylase
VSTLSAHANTDVLEFYRQLPFNIQESVDQQVATIRKRNSVTNYPVLADLLSRDTNLLEVGCGAGWLSNNIAYHYGSRVTAIDFNPVAVERASAVARAMGLPSRFEVADLFLYEPREPADVVASIGVLHHTNDCHGAVRRVCNEFVRPGGYVFIGLYHEYGRRPFLDHFAAMADAGATEEDMFRRYCELMPQTTDETHARSWFRDQVIHPHETQHSLAELLPILEECEVTLERTSINRFEPIGNLDEVLSQEEDYAAISQEWLSKNRYFPGFFLFLGRKAE